MLYVYDYCHRWLRYFDKHNYSCLPEGVSVRIIIHIGRLSKAECSPYCGQASSNQSKICIEQMAKKKFLLPGCLSWDVDLFQPSDSVWNICFSWISSLMVLRQEFTPSALPVLRPSDFDWNYMFTLLAFQFTNCRTWNISASINVWASSLK